MFFSGFDIFFYRTLSGGSCQHYSWMCVMRNSRASVTDLTHGQTYPLQGKLLWAFRYVFSEIMQFECWDLSSFVILIIFLLSVQFLLPFHLVIFCSSVHLSCFLSLSVSVYTVPGFPLRLYSHQIFVVPLSGLEIFKLLLALPVDKWLLYQGCTLL